MTGRLVDSLGISGSPPRVPFGEPARRVRVVADLRRHPRLLRAGPDRGWPAPAPEGLRHLNRAGRDPADRARPAILATEAIRSIKVAEGYVSASTLRHSSWRTGRGGRSRPGLPWFLPQGSVLPAGPPPRGCHDGPSTTVPPTRVPSQRVQRATISRLVSSTADSRTAASAYLAQDLPRRPTSSAPKDGRRNQRRLPLFRRRCRNALTSRFARSHAARATSLAADLRTLWKAQMRVAPEES